MAEKKSPELLKLLYAVEQINNKIRETTQAELKFDKDLKDYFENNQPIGNDNINKLNLFDQAFQRYIEIIHKYYKAISDKKLHAALAKEMNALTLMLKTIQDMEKMNPDFKEYLPYVNKIITNMKILYDALEQFKEDMK